MLDSLLIHQGSGLNSLFLTAEAASPLYNKNENHTTYQLCKDCFLSMTGNHTEPLSQLLNPDACKLLDILVSDLGTERPYPILLSLESYMQLTGRSISESNKKTIRRRLLDIVFLLRGMTLTWKEDGRIYQNVKIFDEICYEHRTVRARFSEEMTRYLLSCPNLKLPCSLFRISSGYSLGRMCLLHSNEQQGGQTICVGSLLDACPQIPRPAPDEVWTSKTLKQKVISPLKAGLTGLVRKGVLLQWNIQGEWHCEDYASLTAGMVEFVVE